jgi:hypothetical protein
MNYSDSINHYKKRKRLIDGVDIVPQDIFDSVESGNGVCKTSAVNVHEYQDIFGKYPKQYDAVFYTLISATFFPVVIKMPACTRIFRMFMCGLFQSVNRKPDTLCWMRQRWAENGVTIERNVVNMNKTAPKVEASFVIDTLNTCIWEDGVLPFQRLEPMSLN